MNKPIIITLTLILLLISGCASSEFGSCYDTCRNIAYLNLTSDCNYISSSIVLKECDVTQNQITSIKNSCYNECKPK